MTTSLPTSGRSSPAARGITGWPGPPRPARRPGARHGRGIAEDLDSANDRYDHQVIRPVEAGMTSSSGPRDVEATGTWIAETRLKAGSLRLTGALMQNITHIAPAIA